MSAGGVTEFRIIIEGEDTGDNGANSNPIPEGEYQVKRTSKIKQARTVSGVVVLGQIAKNTLNFAVSNTGNYTGNSVMQNKVNAGMQMLGYGMQIAANPVLGTVNVLSNLLFKGIEYNQKKSEEANALSQARERAGVNLYRGRF